MLSPGCAPEGEHAEVAHLLAMHREIVRHPVRLEVTLATLPTNDPALFDPDPTALLRAVRARGEVHLWRPVSARAGEESRVEDLRVRSEITGLSHAPEGPRTGASADESARVLPVTRHRGEGVEIRAAAAVEGSEAWVTLAAQDALSGSAWREGPTRAPPRATERQLLGAIAVPLGGARALVLGPRGASETCVLVLAAEGAPAVRVSPIPPLPMSEGRVWTALRTGALDTLEGHLLGGGVAPDVAIDLMKGGSGSEAVWGDGTLVANIDGAFVVRNSPDVVSRMAEVLAGIVDGRRPRAVDAWVLQGPALADVATTVMDETSATALLARAARGDGLTLEARMGGGCSPGGLLEQRVLRRLWVLAGARGEAPRVEEIEGGVEFLVSLEAAPGGVALHLTWTRKEADPALAGPSVAAAPPIVRGLERSARFDLPPEGGYALLVVSGEGGSRGVLVRVGW